MRAAILAACLAFVAGPALAVPPEQPALAEFGGGDENLYFVDTAAPAETGTVRHVWLFVAHRTPPLVEGVTVVGSWMRDRVDCSARTLTHVEFHAVAADFTLAYSNTQESAPERVEPGSLGEAVAKHACGEGADLGPAVGGVREATRRAQGTRA